MEEHGGDSDSGEHGLDQRSVAVSLPLERQCDGQCAVHRQYDGDVGGGH